LAITSVGCTNEAPAAGYKCVPLLQALKCKRDRVEKIINDLPMNVMRRNDDAISPTAGFQKAHCKVECHQKKRQLGHGLVVFSFANLNVVLR